jgi:hypothetical protein
MTNVQCFLCKKYGHIRAFCRTPCTFCGEIARHASENCRFSW